MEPLTIARPLQLSPVLLSHNSLHKTVQDVIVSYRLTITKIEDLPTHLHRIYRVSLSDGSRLILKLPASSNKSLLRHERGGLKNEACALSVLARLNLPIPKTVKYDRKGARLGFPFLLTTHLPGISYADALPYLPRSERTGVEQQLRIFKSSISQHTTQQFGPTALVATGRGFLTWREAFSSIMENVLMDGEDTMINLPYTTIRETVASHSKSLDEVREARLVILGLGMPENVLIEQRTNRVIGLLDLSQAVWGDPGFAGSDPSIGQRGLLYAIYDAVLAVVTNHYRPQRDSRELSARKTLTRILAQLAVDRKDT